MFAEIGLLSGHALLADWLFLIALILFAIAGLFLWSERPDPTHGALVAFGLALIAAGWLVL